MRETCVRSSARHPHTHDISANARREQYPPPRARARLELGDGADEGLLGALELVREPVLQAVEALPEEEGGGDRKRGTRGAKWDRTEWMGTVGREGGSLCRPLRMMASGCWRWSPTRVRGSASAISDNVYENGQTGCWQWRRAWMRRAQSWASSGSSQRRRSKSHVPAELRWRGSEEER